MRTYKIRILVNSFKVIRGVNFLKNEDFLDEINEIDDELKATTSVKGVGGLLRNNVIGDLGNFGFTLLKSGLSTVSCE